MPAAAMNHFTVLTDNLDKTLTFYAELLDLHPGARPPFKFPGAWLYARGGNDPILHIIAGKPKEQLVKGVIDHMAFTGLDLAGTVDRISDPPDASTAQRVVPQLNAIRAASGDQLMPPRNPAPLVRRARFEPPTSTRYSSADPELSPPNAMAAPDGIQAYDPLQSFDAAAETAKRTACAPSASTTRS